MQILNTLTTVEPAISLSACTVGVLDVYLQYPAQSVDLSSITADSCHFVTSFGTTEETMFPAQLRAFVLLTGTSSVPVSIPPWPASLERLQLETSHLSCLPPFPESLAHFDCYTAPQCIPNWPSQLTHYTVLSPYSVVVLPAEAEYCSLLDSNCPGANPTMAGRVALDLDADVVAFEVDLAPLSTRALPRAGDLSRYPSVRRDLAFVVADAVPWAEIAATVRTAAGPLLRYVQLFDRYVGQGVESGQKSLAMGLILQDNSRTLTDADVAQVVAQVVAAIGDAHGAKVRG